jgi:hypothetical protein
MGPKMLAKTNPDISADAPVSAPAHGLDLAAWRHGNEALGRSVFGIDEDNVLRIPARRVNREEYDRQPRYLRYSVHHAFAEEQQMARLETAAVFGAAHPERALARQDVEILVTRSVIVRRGWAVDSKDAAARGRFVGQIGVQQQGVCSGGKLARNLEDVETAEVWVFVVVIHIACPLCLGLHHAESWPLFGSEAQLMRRIDSG